MKWVHLICSGMEGSLAGTGCNVYVQEVSGNGTSPTEALEEDLEVDGETYNTVDNFSYLDNMRSANGGVVAVVIAIVRCA